jgi:hypothetical protein
MVSIKQFRRAGVPLLALETADPAEVIRGIVRNVKNGTTPPVFQWDIIRGMTAANNEAMEIADQLNGGNDPAIATGNPIEALKVLNSLPSGAVAVFLGMADVLIDAQSGAICKQCLWNLRDSLKAIGVMAVLTVPLGWRVPADLVNDVVVVSVPLPSLDENTAMINTLCNDAGINVPPAEVIATATGAVSGLSGYAAEQAIALSISKEGINLDQVWERKRKQIEQTPGLSVWRGADSFDQIGGCENIKRFLLNLIAGKRSPRAVVFIDEIEKAFAGVAGDTSGVSQGMLGALLTFMQDKQSAGMILIGPPGAAKSAVSKCIGTHANCPTIAWDLSGSKGSLVGESEARTRAILQVIDAVGGDRVLFVATCNSIGSLPPELRRRFTLGTFFFDLPSQEERAQIWKIWLSKFALGAQELPLDDGWTGAEIRQCCDIADRLGISLVAASDFVVPVSRSASDQIESLRKTASGKFLNASAPGVYRYEQRAISAQSRKMNIGE